MDSLIERIEAATEGLRELDAAIEDAVNPLPSGDRPRWPFAEGSNLSEWTPRYTASLDAAMTLVPEGFCWTVAVYWCEGEDKPPYFADCADLPAMQAGDFQVPIHEAWAATPALALCAAALKARTLPHDR